MFRHWAEYSPAPMPSARAARLGVVLALGLSVCSAYGQTLIPGLSPGGTMRLRQTDFAVLELQEPRHDLPCTVSRMKPELDWDFTFHTGYHVELPFAELVGDGNELSVLFRVIPQDRPDDPVYMAQRIHIPAVEEGAKGPTTFHGNFSFGEGKYHIDWLMRDQRERLCATSWDLEMKLNSKDSQLREWIPQSLVLPLMPLFAEEPPVVRASESGLPHVSIIVYFDPADPSSTRLDDQDVKGLVAILRRIGGDPHIGTYSIIACSLATQQVVYQQENASRLDLKALGEALALLKFGTVDAKRLASTNGPAQFAADLIREHLMKNRPDALVVLGRKAGSETGVSRAALESLPGTPTFYLSYNAELQPNLWRDPISTIVKSLRGFEYGINRPKDLFHAWSDVMSRIAQTKQAAQPATAAKSTTR